MERSVPVSKHCFSSHVADFVDHIRVQSRHGYHIITSRSLTSLPPKHSYSTRFSVEYTKQLLTSAGRFI